MMTNICTMQGLSQAQTLKTSAKPLLSLGANFKNFHGLTITSIAPC